jgi:nicotinic acid mononucleotide adenylyltransferase
VLTGSERRRLRPLAAALRRAAEPGPPRLELVAGELGGARRGGLLAGSFNPFTRAHAALALAGRRAGRERVVLAMAPASLDKEAVERAHPLDRLAWTVAWATGRSWAAVAVSSSALLVDMAEALVARGLEVTLLVGADKAAQLVDPRYYPDPEAAVDRLARAATVLIAPRAEHVVPALPLRTGVLATPPWAPSRSATAARAQAARGGDLSALVPAAVAAAVTRTRAYDPDPEPYRRRATALSALVASASMSP